MCGMCGIAAAERRQKIDADTLRRMADVIEYRGPDDAGIYVSGRSAWRCGA
jgi:asparagine synthetase B (glutamine-hydrolysing)